MTDKHADTPDEAALVERVARAIAVTLDPCGGPNSAWQYRGDARAAIAAMQPEIAAAYEAGRRKMAEEAAAVCQAKSTNIRSVNTNRGRIGATAVYGADVADKCAALIRALVQPGAATEAGHG